MSVWRLDRAAAQVGIAGADDPAAGGDEVAIVGSGDGGALAVMPLAAEAARSIAVPGGRLRLVRLADLAPAQPVDRWPAFAGIVVARGAPATLRAR